jgi:membrane protease YdiL (CAAX protease family)
METPAVRQVERETIFALALVLLWVLWRVANYAGGIQISCAGPGWCVDWCAVIVPKMLGMVIVPVVVLKLARYTFTALGLSIARRVWLPALAPILALVALGLNAQGAEAFGLSALCFFFSAGLPEEVLFRGVLQTRLEAWLKNPAWALFLASFIFGASHLPINLHGFGLADWMDAVGAAFTFQMGYGFAFGLAYQRVRNLWPLAVVHALVDAAS